MLSPVAGRAVSGRFTSSGADDTWATHRGSHDEERPSTPDDKQTYSGRYLVTCLIGYSLSFVVFGSQVSILGPTIAALAERLHVAEPDLSPLFTALGISCIVSGTPSGWLVDHLPTHHVLVGSLLLEAVGFSLVPLMPSVWSLTALYFVVCFSYNFTNSAVFTSLAWMFPKRAGPGINLVLAMFGLGSFFIPLVAQACKTYLDSPLSVFRIIGGLALVSAVPFLFVTSPTRPAGGNTGGSGSARHHASRSLELVTTLAVVVLVFFTTAAETAIGNWLYTFSLREVHSSDSDAALANSTFWGAFTIGRVIGAAISHATTPLVLLLGSVPFSILGCSVPIFLGRSRLSHGVVMLMAALTGLGNSTGYANAVALLERYVPVTGFINGVFGAVAGGACMVGPVLVAMIAKYSSLRYMAMPWVGLMLYALHLPAILIAALVGDKLLKLPLEPEQEPFLSPAGPTIAAAVEEPEAGAQQRVAGTIVAADANGHM
ncbi:hypothetical protein Vretimale_12423 [Volvox reticuliferus]|uniref:Major facilitator superfamily (MFS) profile domain-containing protein n=1 Tax=Volvox reticuliferus TaxID=1737510 RepID=A0A8J4CC15_9CHLO|nr:hypothetical protein Vretifemale_9097 [Volvox reticuliferus]GIM08416.1 hypothetical protein Vretimale_12423 [Volvox reticuliferus]